MRLVLACGADGVGSGMAWPGLAWPGLGWPGPGGVGAVGAGFWCRFWDRRPGGPVSAGLVRGRGGVPELDRYREILH